MRYGVISDLHSNREALVAALARLKAEGVEGWVCCGDIVGYGPDPDATVAALAVLPNLRVVIGNHDLAVLGRMDLDWFNEYARAAVLWTRDHMGQEARAFLETLTDRVETPEFTVVHGSPRNPAEEYLLTSEQFLANLKYFTVSPCFIGHSHLPVYFSQVKEGRVRGNLIKDGEIVSAGEGACVLNPGSVGQPRDKDPRASCGVYDSERREFRLLRVEYPVKEVQAKIRKAGLPDFLAERLEHGE